MDYIYSIINAVEFNVKFNSKDRETNALCDICASFGWDQTGKNNTILQIQNIITDKRCSNIGGNT